MSHKGTLLLITILLAVASIQFWSSDPADGQAAAGPLPQNLPHVSFSSSSISVIEPDAGETKTITLEVRISSAPAPGEEVQVTARSADGSAVAGQDYLSVAETLTFPAGSTNSQSIDILLIGNNRYQPNRTFFAFLVNPINAAVSPPADITIHIVDNDRPPPSSSFLPIIRGHLARTPIPPTATPTPCPYC